MGFRYSSALVSTGFLGQESIYGDVICVWKADSRRSVEDDSDDEGVEGEEEMEDMDMDIESEEEEDEPPAQPVPPPRAASSSKPKPRTGDMSGGKNPYPLEGRYIDEDDRDQCVLSVLQFLDV